MKKRYLFYILLILILSILLISCNSNQKNRDFEDNGKFNIITTTTLVGDLVKNIGGENVNVISLMGPGVDPHGYKTSAGDVSLMHKSDMIIYNGLNLEGKMGELFKNFQDTDKLIMAISDDISNEKFIDFVTNPGNYDPHIWFSVKLWEDAALNVKNGLNKLDPENSKLYEKNYENYLEELEELDKYIRNRIDELPEEKRILVTAHDAFNYFGNEYGFRVKGLQGISTSSEAGTSDVTNLANFIVENQVKAIFIESSVPMRSIEALKEAVHAQNFDLKIGGELYSDSTGDIGTEAESYIGTFKANIDTIIDALK